MPGRSRKEPTRESRAQEAEEVEHKIDDAAGHICLVIGAIDEQANQELVNDWRQIQVELEALAERARKLAC